MNIVRILFLIALLIASISNAFAKPAITAPVKTSELNGYADYPENTRTLIAIATSLSQKNLTYQYGSDNPKNNGMDCSGTIHYLLTQAKIKDVPRQSDEMYLWSKQKGKFYPVTKQDFNTDEFSKLKPGDLLFWEGTYAVNRNPPISHVMIYLGENKNNQPLMFGASDGRTYQGKRMRGVSVFDLVMPNKKSHAKFIGYSCVPTFTCENK